MKKAIQLCFGMYCSCISLAQPVMRVSLETGLSLPVKNNGSFATYASNGVHFGGNIDVLTGSNPFRIGIGAYIGYFSSAGTDDEYKTQGLMIAKKFGLETNQLSFNQSSFKTTHFLIGPVADWQLSKLHINLWAKGGYALNEPGRFAVIDKTNGAVNNIYVNQNGDNKKGIAYNAGAGISYPVLKQLGLLLSANYFNTKTDQVNYNYEREKGTAPQFFTASNQFIQASVGLQWSFGKEEDKRNKKTSMDKSQAGTNGITEKNNAKQELVVKSNEPANQENNNQSNNNNRTDSLFFVPQKIELRSNPQLTNLNLRTVPLNAVNNYLTGFVYQTANGPVINQCSAAAMDGDPVPGIDVKLEAIGAPENGARPGNPIPGVVVKGGKNTFTVQTNPDGSFSVNDIAPGNYNAFINKDSFVLSVRNNIQNEYKVLNVPVNECTSVNNVIYNGDKMYVEVIRTRDAASGMATGKKHVANIKWADRTVSLPGEGATAQFYRQRMHKPFKVSNSVFEVNWDNIVTDDNKLYAEVNTAREVSGSMATGRSALVTGDVDGDGIPEYAALSPGDMSTGHANFQRMHKPFVITKELNADAGDNYEVSSPRDVATGQSSGKHMHKPIVIAMELDANNNYQVVSPGDVATGQSTGKRMHKPITITMDVDADGDIAGEKVIHRDLATRNMLVTGTTNNITSPRDAASGLATGRKFNKKADESFQPGGMEEGVVTNPLYQDNGNSGTNPLFESKTALRVNGSNGVDHDIFIPENMTILPGDNPDLVPFTEYKIGPLKWMAPESMNNRKGWDGTVKGGNASSEKNINTSEANVGGKGKTAVRKGWDGTVKGGNVSNEKNINTSEANLGSGEGGTTRTSINTTRSNIKHVSRMNCVDGTCTIEAIVEIDGSEYEAVITGAVKTKDAVCGQTSHF
jgi:hypothetical protein